MSDAAPETVVQSTLCIACRDPIPAGAKICKICKEYQNWRRHFAVTVIIVGFVSTAITVIGALVPPWSYFLERNSRTRFKVTSSDDNHVYLKVWNSGRKPSTLVGYRLIFDSEPQKVAMLDLGTIDKIAASNVIQPGAPVKIGLARPLPAAIPASQVANEYSDAQLTKLLDSKSPTDLSMTLEIQVEESDDPSGDFLTFIILEQLDHGVYFSLIAAPRQNDVRRDQFPASRISEFIHGSLQP